MDSSSELDTSQLDVSRLSQRDKQELQQFIQNESSRAKLQQSIHNLTDICFKKCITGSIRSGKLEKAEETCTQNCVDRFLDGNLAVLKHLEVMRGQS